ncbi:MAG: serine hydrolase domain-containing protein [Hellea sp.]
MKHKLTLITAAIGVIGVLSACAVTDRIKRLHYASSLFSGKEQYENFARIPQIFPVSTVNASPSTQSWQIGGSFSLPAQFSHRGETATVERFLQETDTAGLLIIHDGKIHYENYWLTGGLTVQWPSWSVAKSYVSALIGIAIDDGLIGSVKDPISNYLPELKETGYDGVSIEDILEMSSGARWNEDYSDFKSDINRLGRIIALGGSLDKFVTTIGPDIQPGTYNRYNSADTQVLGRLLVKVSGQTLSEYMQAKIWAPLEAEDNGYWLIDNKGMEMAFAGFHATARDYARLGELYRNFGHYNGHQIIPEQWVVDSTHSTKPHLQSGENPASNNDFGYGYQWWLLDGHEGEYTAMGVYNQFIYVNPTRDIVIVKLSANSEFGVRDDQSSYRDQETISLLRALSASFPRSAKSMALETLE